jgi:hypothetical protein
MGRAKEWNKATRVKGGVHIYVPKEPIEAALLAAGLPADASDLKVRTIWLKSDHRKSARLIVEFKINDLPAKPDQTP